MKTFKSFIKEADTLGADYFKNIYKLKPTDPPRPNNMNVYAPVPEPTELKTNADIDKHNFNIGLDNEKLGIQNAAIYADKKLASPEEFRDNLKQEVDKLAKAGGPATLPKPKYVEPKTPDQYYQTDPIYKKDVDDWNNLMINNLPYPGQLPTYDKDGTTYYDTKKFPEPHSVQWLPQRLWKGRWRV